MPVSTLRDSRTPQAPPCSVCLDCIRPEASCAWRVARSASSSDEVTRRTRPSLHVCVAQTELSSANQTCVTRAIGFMPFSDRYRPMRRVSDSTMKGSSERAAEPFDLTSKNTHNRARQVFAPRTARQARQRAVCHAPGQACATGASRHSNGLRPAPRGHRGLQSAAAQPLLSSALQA